MKMFCLYFILFYIGGLVYAEQEHFTNFEEYVRIKRQNNQQYSHITLDTIIMKLDNFDPNNNNTWIMRFYHTSKYFKPNGPLFILNGGEQSITPFPLDYSLMSEIAKQNGAQLVNLEHRYYGESIPDKYFTYLSVEQALADMAFFIQEYKRVRSEFRNSKVVLFGTSYAGTLAIWMRLKYPNLVHAAMASSAPVLAKVDFHEYWEEIYRLLGQNCVEAFNKAETNLMIILNQPKGEDIIRNDYNLTGSVNLNRLQRMLQGNMLYIVNQNQCGLLTQACGALVSPNESKYKVMTTIRKKTNDRRQFLNKHYDNSHNYLAWFYQLCTQFGFFQTNRLSSLESQMNQCQLTFGPQFTPESIKNGIKNLNANFGGQNVRVTRVVSIYGTGDPWHILGLRQSSNPQAPVIYIPGSAHGKDVYPINSKCDSQEMINAKIAVQAYITQWLKEN